MTPFKDFADRIAAAQQDARQLQHTAARVASDIADTESHGADLYQAMAQQREDHDPEHSERLRAMSTHAREFAHTEREAGQLQQ